MQRLLPALILTALLLPRAGAGTVVRFVDGRSMEVVSVEIQANLATLHLEGGSQIRVPATRIENFQARSAAKSVRAAAPVQRAEATAWRRLAGLHAATIEAAAQRHGLDPRLLTAVAQVESGFDPAAVSPMGARGLLQLMPATARRFGVSDSFDPTQNVEGGAQYLRWLLDRFSGSQELALAGFNAGEGAVERYDGIPPFPETQQYVVRVMARLQHLQTSPDAMR